MKNEPFNALSVFVVLPVSDLEQSIDWYKKVLGRMPDHQPAPIVADYYLAPDKNPQNGTLQLVVDTKRAGGGLANINVSSNENVNRSLVAQGINVTTVTVPVIADATSSIMVSTVIDPDGNAISLVQAN